MESSYDVMHAQQCIGKAQIVKQGLYYHISCKCRLSGQVLCRLIVFSDAGQTDLGILVPKEGRFTIETKIPVKKIGTQNIRFVVLPKPVRTKGRYVPLKPEEPFAYLSQLYNAFLTRIDTQIGVTIVDQNDRSMPTGQWSEPNISANIVADEMESLILSDTKK